MEQVKNPEINKIYIGNTLEIMKTWPDNYIDCVMTSPPYWNQRDYGEETSNIWDGNKYCEHQWKEKEEKFKRMKESSKSAQVHKGKALKKYNINQTTGVCLKCGAWKGQLGQEPTSEMFIKHLCDIFGEIIRILKPEGTCFVNIGDTYKKNNKLMIPAKFAIEMQKRGWTLRNEIIWHKTTSIPESVTNRFTNDYENIYFFTKKPNEYFFKQYKLPTRTSSKERSKYGSTKRKIATSKGFNTNEPTGERSASSDGKNMRSVWNIKVGAYRGGEHIAKYSVALCKIPLQTGCPENGIVYDPFIGSGTTAVAALQLGKRYIGTEINEAYAKEANKRIQEIKKYYGI